MTSSMSRATGNYKYVLVVAATVLSLFNPLWHHLLWRITVCVSTMRNTPSYTYVNVIDLSTRLRYRFRRGSVFVFFFVNFLFCRLQIFFPSLFIWYSTIISNQIRYYAEFVMLVRKSVSIEIMLQTTTTVNTCVAR